MLEPLSYIHIKKSTPAPAVAMQGLMAFLFILSGDIHELIDFASFLIWFFYGSAIVALLVLRRTQPNTPRPYRVPTIIPILILGVAVFLSTVPIVADPSPKYLFAIGFILSGVLVYIPFVYYRKRPRIMSKFFVLVTNCITYCDISLDFDQLTKKKFLTNLITF